MIFATMLAASDLWQMANNFWSNLETTGKGGIKAAGVVLIAICIIKGGTIVKMAGIVLTVGIALWAVVNLTGIGDKVGNTIDPAVVSMAAPAWLLGASA